MKPSDRLILSLDTQSTEQEYSLLERFEGEVGCFKVGLSGFMRSYTEVFHDFNGPFFLDLKLCDIPNTLRNTAREIRKFNLPNIKYLTVMAAAGADGISAVAEELPNVNILVVTFLTSNVSVFPATAAVLTKWAGEAGASGCVCSAHEVNHIREAVGEDFLIVTPGMRLPTDQTDDQKRRATPEFAISQGADFVVVGRPIINSSDPTQAILNFVESIEKGIK